MYGSAEEDEWHCDCIKQECVRREKPEIFLRAENNILAMHRVVIAEAGRNAPQQDTIRRRHRDCSVHVDVRRQYQPVQCVPSFRTICGDDE